MENLSKKELIKALEDSNLKLQEVEKQYKMLIDNSLLGIYTTNMQGDILFANKALANILGYDSVDELKKSKSYYKYPEQRKLLISKITRYKKVTNFEAELLTKDKKSKYVLLNETLYEDKLFGMMLDITLRKKYVKDIIDAQINLEKMNEKLEVKVNRRTEKLNKQKIKLAEDEEKFRNILENVSDLIFTIDKNGILTYVSDSSFNLLGYYSKDLFGKSFYDFISLNDKEQFQTLYYELIRTNYKFEDQVFKIKNHDNNWKWFLISGSLIKSGSESFFLGVAKDITKRKKIDEVIYQSEKKFRAIIESSKEGIISISLESLKVIYANPTFCKQLDYKLSEILDKNFRYFLADSPITQFNYYIEELNKNGELYLKSLIFKQKNNTKIITNANFVISEIFGEKVIYAFIQDITNIIKDEEKIKILSTAVEQSPVSIMITDNNGTITYVNKQFLINTGYDFKEIYGKTPKILNSGTHSKDFFKNLWDTILSGNTWQNEILNKRKNGELFWDLVNISPIFDDNGAILNFVGFQLDITNKKYSEQALRLSEKKSKIIYENASETIVIINELGMITAINPAGLKKFGYEFEDLIGKNVSILMPQAYAIKHNEYLDRFRNTKIPHALGRSVEVEGLKKNGEKFPILISLSKYENEDSIIFIAVISDITEFKNAQDQLLQAGKMAALGKLIAGIAHEINSPLGAVKSQNDYFTREIEKIFKELPTLISELSPNIIDLMSKMIEESINNTLNLSIHEERKIKRKLIDIFEKMELSHSLKLASNFVNIVSIDRIETYKPILEHEQNVDIINMVHKFVNIKSSSTIIHTATDSIMRIVLALKTYTHTDNSGEPVATDITKGIDTVLTLYHNKTKHGVTIKKNYQYKEPIMCFPDELNQVWTNLIHNSLQAMEFKGSLDIKVFKENNHLVATFGDSGKGIPEEIKDKIFDPFFTTKPPGEGSGLGLDIIKKIIEKHKGEITFDSKVNKGTIFKIKLPINN